MKLLAGLGFVMLFGGGCALGVGALSLEAQRTPVMALSTADGLAGRDFASMARDRVFHEWERIGNQMGFDWRTVKPVDENRRLIEATPLRRDSGEGAAR